MSPIDVPKKKVCSKCFENKRLDEYYISSTKVINEDGNLPICKDCLVNLVDMENVERFIEILRMIDRPFLIDTYKRSLSSDRQPFREYMRMMATHQFRDYNFSNSMFDTKTEHMSNSKEANRFLEKISNGKLMDDENGEYLRKKWGNYSREGYEFLEDFYRPYEYSYSTETPAQIVLYKNIAKVHYEAEKALSKGEIKQFKDLMDLSSKMHNDGKIKPVQNTGADEDRGLSTYGLWIKDIEKDEPCEYFENRKLYEDYDKIKKYWQKWFVRPFKNIFGVSNDFDEEEQDG